MIPLPIFCLMNIFMVKVSTAALIVKELYGVEDPFTHRFTIDSLNFVKSRMGLCPFRKTLVKRSQRAEIYLICQQLGEIVGFTDLRVLSGQLVHRTLEACSACCHCSRGDDESSTRESEPVLPSSPTANGYWLRSRFVSMRS